MCRLINLSADILRALTNGLKLSFLFTGSYDAQKYNTDGDYTHDNGGNIQYNGAQLSQFEKRPESDASAVGTFNHQNSQAFGKPGSTQFGTGSNAQNPHVFNGQSSTDYGNSGSGHFGAASNAQNSFNGQLNRKPGVGQIGISESQSVNGQSTQVDNRPDGSVLFGSGSQSAHSTFGQGQGSQFNSNPALNDNSGSQSTHSSKPLGGHHGSSATGQSFGHTGIKFTSSSGQAQDSFGSQTQFGSQFGQQGSSSPQLENQSPELSSQQKQQPTKPSLGQSAVNSVVTSQFNQPQFGSSFKPQGSEAFSGASLNQDQDTQDFGKPSPQTFSGQNFNRPSAVKFNDEKPSFGQSQVNFGSATANDFNRFPQASGQLGAQNDYLPPFNSNGQPQPNKPESSTSGFTSNLSSSALNSNGQKQGQKYQIPDFVALNRAKPSFASASASTSTLYGQPAFQPQPARPLNAFIDAQPQSKPNHSSQQHTTQFIQQTSQLSSKTPVQFNSDTQQSSSITAQSVPDLSSKPTAVPDTELTTPLEPNETPSSQGSQFSSQTASSFGSFGSKPASNSQTQAQFGFQGNSAIGQQPTRQTSSPNFPTSSPNTNSQLGTALSQTPFQSSKGKGPENFNGQQQLTQNRFGQSQQNQGIDDSYYYNQPSKAFSSSSVHPQGSRFPSSPSYQSNGVGSQNQFFNQQSFQSTQNFPGSPSLAPVRPTSETKFAHTQGYNGITQADISSFPSAYPTPSSQFSTTQNSQFGTKPSFHQQSTFGNQAQSHFNQQSGFGNQGQLTGNQEIPRFPVQPISGRFPSKPVSQTIGNQENTFPQPVNGRLPTRPISGSPTQTQFGQYETRPESSNGSPQQQTLTQQYPGTIYEYNKPAEVLPAQTDSSSSQTIQTGVTTETKLFSDQSQANQLPSQLHSKPFSQVSEVGSKDAQNKPFGASFMTHLGQHSQTTGNTQQTGVQFGSLPAKPSNAQSSTNTQFSQTVQSGDQPDRPFGTSSITQPGQTAQPTHSSSSQQKTQSLQTAQIFKPFGSASQSVQSPVGSKPLFDSQTTQTSQTTKPSGPQFSSQTFQNGQDNGYFYPKNPKPQFAEESKNQFSLNSQSNRPQSGLNQNQNAQSASTQLGAGLFNQQSFQFNSASKPQFGSIQDNQNTQATISQKAPNFPIQPFNQPQSSPPQFDQPTASSQTFASGQATASASATSSPQEYKPFGSQDKTQFSQNQKPDIGQGTQQFGAPFGGNTQVNEASNSNVQGSVDASKPLFNSACCQGSKDATPAQSTNKPISTSFQGTQSFNTQSFAGKGEQFGGPRQPPRFDEQTGYHY